MGRLGLAGTAGRGAGQPDGGEGTAGLGAAVTHIANWHTRLAGPGSRVTRSRACPTAIDPETPDVTAATTSAGRPRAARSGRRVADRPGRRRPARPGTGPAGPGRPTPRRSRPARRDRRRRAAPRAGAPGTAG